MRVGWTVVRRALARIALSAALVLPAASAFAQNIFPFKPAVASYRLLRIAPSPVAEGAPFNAIAEVSNASTKSTNFVITLHSDITSAPIYLTLPPRGSQLIALGGVFQHAASYSVRIDAERYIGPGTSGDHGLINKKLYAAVSGDSLPLTVYSAQQPPPAPRLVDLGPDTPPTIGIAATTGVVGTITGSIGLLVAIPKTGGVWTSPQAGNWSQLAAAPPRAFSIAIDAHHESHMLVGERSDDTIDPELGRSGLWETVDGGATWSRIYDAAPETGGQAIAAVAISETTGTIFAATQQGLRRIERPAPGQATSGILFGSRAPTCAQPTQPLGRITALALGATAVWARSPSEVFRSDDDGKTFACFTLPTSVNLPAVGGVNMNGLSVLYDSQQYGDPPTGAGAPVGGDDQASLGAIDSDAFIIFKAFVPVSDPRSYLDEYCDPGNSHYKAARTVCLIQVPSPLMHVAFRSGRLSSSVQWTGDADGRGENGRRFVKIYEVSESCPSYQSATIGHRFQLIYGAGQSLQQALSMDATGAITFDKVVGGAGDSAAGLIQTFVHNDFWDAYLPKDYCPERFSTAFIANDGGVYQGSSAWTDGHLRTMGWGLRGAGLRAHNVHDTVVTASATASGDILSGLAYPVSDNGGWWRGADGVWSGDEAIGDGNYAAGDIGSHFALLWRQLGGGCAGLGCAVLDDFNGGAQHIVLNNVGVAYGPTQIQAIQTGFGETPPNDSLDMAMLVSLPLSKADGATVSDPPGGTGTGTRPALIRNENFNANPDGPNSGWQGWVTVSDQLPAGTQRFWVSGGHVSPTWFVWTDSTNPTCADGLWRLTPAASGAWSCMASGLTFVTAATHGPAFVDPFDPRQLLIDLAAPQDRSQARIQISTDAGAHFCDAPVLTALVTQSGDYPIVQAATGNAEYAPRDAIAGVSSRYQGVPTSVPSAVAFNRHGPFRYLVGSPFTGLYLGVPRGKHPFERFNGDNCQTSGWAEPVWRDLTGAIPSSRSYISAVTLLDNAAVVAGEGRGVYELTQIEAAPLASWLSADTSAASCAPLSTLRGGDGSPLAWEPVSVSISVRQGISFTPLITNTLRISGKDGTITAPGVLPAGQYLIDLTFAGDGAVAATSIKFTQTISIH
jgi:hypothetical protein